MTQYQNVEEALVNNLDLEGLIRLMAVEKTIEFYHGKDPDEKTFQRTMTQIYNALKGEFNMLNLKF